MKKFITFISKALSENGEPSSKRLVGFILVFYALIIFTIKGNEIDFEFFISLLGSGLAALGITTFNKKK